MHGSYSRSRVWTQSNCAMWITTALKPIHHCTNDTVCKKPWHTKQERAKVSKQSPFLPTGQTSKEHCMEKKKPILELNTVVASQSEGSIINYQHIVWESKPPARTTACQELSVSRNSHGMETTSFHGPTPSWCTVQEIIKPQLRQKEGQNDSSHTEGRTCTICTVRMQEKEGAQANMVTRWAEKQLISPIRTALSCRWDMHDSESV